MQIGKGKFARYESGLPHFAAVEVEIADSIAVVTVKTRCSGEGWAAQGYVEEVTEDGYESWKRGAVAGAHFALTDMPPRGASIILTKIEGLTTDTTPSIIAAAAAYAVWNALGHAPSDLALEKLDEIAFTSWSHDNGYVPFAELGVSQDGT